MALRSSLIFAVICCGVGLFGWSGVSSAQGGDRTYAYVGTKTCKKCHRSGHKSWEKTRMSKAFETLKPGNASDAKNKHGLDAAKDYTKDASCLKCHTVGHGAEGGYVIPDQSLDAKALKKAIKRAKSREGVGCESCHGPGEQYVKVFKEIMKSKRKYDVAELHAVGLRKMDASVCKTCHNGQGPTFDKSKTFVFEKAKEADTHDHVPLKQRKG